MEHHFLGLSIGKCLGATNIWKGGPVIPDRNVRVPFLQSHLWYHFQAFEVVFRKIELLGTNGQCDSGTKFISPEFCVPFAHTVNRPVCLHSLSVKSLAVRFKKLNTLLRLWKARSLTFLSRFYRHIRKPFCIWLTRHRLVPATNFPQRDVEAYPPVYFSRVLSKGRKRRSQLNHLIYN